MSGMSMNIVHWCNRDVFSRRGIQYVLAAPSPPSPATKVWCILFSSVLNARDVSKNVAFWMETQLTTRHMYGAIVHIAKYILYVHVWNILTLRFHLNCIRDNAKCQRIVFPFFRSALVSHRNHVYIRTIWMRFKSHCRYATSHDTFLFSFFFPSYLCIHIWAQNTFNLTNNDSQWQISKASRSASYIFIHSVSYMWRSTILSRCCCIVIVHGIDSKAQQMEKQKLLLCDLLLFVAFLYSKCSKKKLLHCLSLQFAAKAKKNESGRRKRRTEC